MITKVYLKGENEPLVYNGDRIDVLDFEYQGVLYKQIRFFRKGFSKSELIASELVEKVVNEE